MLELGLLNLFRNLLYKKYGIYGWGPGDEWIKDNVQSRKPLGGCYPDRIWASEGDSPSFLYVYVNGLNVPDSLAYGGWGGRFKMERTAGIRGVNS